MEPATHRKRFGIWKIVTAIVVTILLCGMTVWSQTVNSGSTGADGELRPSEHLLIDMRDRPDGVYNYTSVYIPKDVWVAFISNNNDSPVTWLVSGDVT
ncbi:MAG: hypothetical protein ABIH23_09665, partial [bacterium]